MGDHYANIPVHRRMLSGEVAGLRTGAEIAKELGEKKRREQESLRKQDPKIMGYGAETVYRDKHGRKLDMLNQLMNQQAGKLGTEEEAGMEWGKGKIDKEEKEKQEKELREAANAPYRGRTSDNQYMNSRLKQVDRWGDPMAGLISKEVVSTKEVEVIDEKGRKKTKHRKLWMGGYPPNRFDIRPGHRWDGKDRSNGFEKEYFQKKNATKIRQQEAYRWSAGDM
jgi:pre-mRNA-splicing factor CWC26